MSLSSIRRTGAFAAVLLVLGLGWLPRDAAAQASAAPSATDAGLVTYVLMGEGGQRVARVITPADHCPMLRVDGRRRPMQVRAPAQVVPQRPTASDPGLSKPSDFSALVCEATLPAKALRASVAGRPLPLPPRVIRRIVVIGDTGCRVKGKAEQACNDLAAYPFAQVAATAARWKPDLVVHVGDYLYRENACGADDAGCAGSPWGYGYDAWHADFFGPAAPLLRVAPWAAARGNHESCDRAGQGWWRFLDPRSLVAGRDCNTPENDLRGDYSDPYAVPLGQSAQLILFDSSDTPAKPLAAGQPGWDQYRDTYAKIAALTDGADHNILVDHHPMLAFAATQKHGDAIVLRPGDAGLQSTFGSLNPQLFPPKVDLLLSGHVHVWEALSFAPPYPAQIVTGFSGTQEDIVPLPKTLPPGETPAPGAVVQAMSSWVDGFGFMTLTRQGPDRWLAQIRDVNGAVVNTCHVAGRQLTCALDQVPRHN